MKKLSFIFLVSALTVAGGCSKTATPYAGEQTRTIKALSAQDIEGYLGGAGMGYAKAAELNSYPGPLHVLELATALALTPQQTTATQQIYDAMKKQTSALGAKLVAKEQQVDGWFANGNTDTQALQQLLDEIGALEAQIRYTHLNAHVAQRQLLTAAEINRYDALRGYADGTHDHQHVRCHLHIRQTCR